MFQLPKRHASNKGYTMPAQQFTPGKITLKSHLVYVALEELQLDGVNVCAEDMKPMFFPVDLSHVNVASGDSLVSTLETWIVGRTIRPLTKVFHLLNQFLAEALRHQGHPEDVSTGLFKVVFCHVGLREFEVLWVNVAIFPVLNGNCKENIQVFTERKSAQTS